MSGRPPRRLRRRWISALAVSAAALVAAPAASAHAVLVATEPARDAVAEESPSRVLLRFNEPVEAILAGTVSPASGGSA